MYSTVEVLIRVNMYRYNPSEKNKVFIIYNESSD